MHFVFARRFCMAKGESDINQEQDAGIAGQKCLA